MPDGDAATSPVPRTVDVHVAVDGADLRAGRLHGHAGRGAESATFTYADTYLADPRAYALEPALPLTAGPQQTPAGLAMFRSFGDTSPDRWGRRLVERAERRRAAADGSASRRLTELSLLLGVRDDLRQGALRFADPATGRFLAEESTGVPALTDLGDLLALADGIEDEETTLSDLRVLLRAGSSLGGARPKAHVRTLDGRIAIAKFPSANSDTHDVMAWEKTTLDLAGSAGIDVPGSQLLNITGRSVLVVDRFDRNDHGRVGYASAMTLLETRDGQRGTYLDIGAAIEENSPHATRDLHQLWRRAAFGVLVSNTDDHLRNHGFLHRSAGSWSLSPAFDLNPDPAPGPKQLATALADVSDPRASVDVLLQIAGEFRLAPEQARGVLSEVLAATDRWRTVGRSHGLREAELRRMAPAFEHDEVEAARVVVAST